MNLKSIPAACAAALLVASPFLRMDAADPSARKAGASRRATAPAHPIHGSVDRFDPALDALIAPGVQMERLASGFNWSEGPTWLPREKAVVFSDVPENVVYCWSERDGLSVYLKPSGYTGQALEFNEQGSNGLTTDAAGRLVLCQHGDRRIARLDRGRVFTPLASHFDNRRFNSPNDLVFDRRGNLYFTDPPYGLKGGNDGDAKELAFNGVYLLRPGGGVQLLATSMTFPNGIALSPDERTLYVNQSDPKAPIIRAFPVLQDGTLGQGRTFFDTTRLMEKGGKGLPDGLKVDVRGNVFATGPGGVLVLSPEGRLLGLLNTGEATGNCCWGDDGATLYITADMHLLRIRTRTTGHGFRR
ncbi:MAG: SMP-30/gluconolactonase/LRE family protein [Verrucomicrobiota bacterium]